jgi:RNA polymerase sigma factor (sigma-70 family)
MIKGIHAGKLPDNEIQKIQKELERGKRFSMEHDDKTEKELMRRFQNGDSEAVMELIRLYLDVISVVYRRPFNPPFFKEVYAIRSLRYEVFRSTPQNKEDYLQAILENFIQLVSENDQNEERELKGLILGKLHMRVYDRFIYDFIEQDSNLLLVEDVQNYVDKSYKAPVEEKPKDYTELYKALDTLSERQREVVELSTMKGWNSTEIAQEIGIDAKTVRVHLKRGLDKLKLIMGA